MRYSFLFALILVPSLTSAGPMLTPRPVDSLAAQTLAHALEHSATVRSMVVQLESSNLIVHIETSRALPMGIDGTTRFVTSRGGYRYARITVNADLPPRPRSAILAHELQHACEIAASGASDLDSLRRLFEHAGYRYGDYYETSLAMKTEQTVRTELRTSARRSDVNGKR